MIAEQRGSRVRLWCPACADLHMIDVGPGGWTWNGNTEVPDVSPSIRVRGVQWEPSSPFFRASHHVETGGQTVCHSFLRNGQWQFLSDCTHDLAGQTVAAVPLPEWMVA